MAMVRDWFEDLGGGPVASEAASFTRFMAGVERAPVKKMPKLEGPADAGTIDGGDANNVEELYSIVESLGGGSAGRKPEPKGLRSGTTRNSSMMVGDRISADREVLIGKTWASTTGETDEAFARNEINGTMEWSVKGSTVQDMSDENREKCATLYLYGEDEKIDIRPKQEYGDPYGDGLVSFKSAEIWPYKITDPEQIDRPTAEKKDGTQFKRVAFKWRKMGPVLLGGIGGDPNNGIGTEQVITWAVMEKFSSCRETEHQHIVIPEFEQCVLVAAMAVSAMPAPPVVYSRKGSGKDANHVDITEFVAERKMYIMPEPPEGDETNVVCSRMANVKRSADDPDKMEELMMATVKAMYLKETKNGWMKMDGDSWADEKGTFITMGFEKRCREGSSASFHLGDAPDLLSTRIHS